MLYLLRNSIVKAIFCLLGRSSIAYSGKCHVRHFEDDIRFHLQKKKSRKPIDCAVFILLCYDSLGLQWEILHRCTITDYVV
jgi:hypothetical protein